MFAKLMADYFTFVNDKEGKIQAEDKETIIKYEFLSFEKRMHAFCKQHKLQDKAMKEVHFLSLQLQRIFFDQELGE